MKIIRTFVPDSAQNFNHLVYCPVTRQAAAIDPFDAQHLLSIANEHDLTINQIWITHEHWDHIKDLPKLKALTNATVSAPDTCQGRFDSDQWLQDNTAITLGNGTVMHWHTPGHTPGHSVYAYQSSDQPELDFIVCGDTLFNAGVGNTYSGDTKILYESVTTILQRLSPSTRLFPGHDYLPTNLKFVIHHFPDCEAAKKTLQSIGEQSPNNRTIKSIADEMTYNPFLSLDAPWLLKHNDFTDIDNEQIFLKLRDLRDQW